jgi:uncharacterized protein with HEPN domain
VRSKSQPDRAEQRAADVLASIEAIASYIVGLDVTAFRADRKTTSATERELLIIAEAMTKLRELEAQLPLDKQFESRFPHVNAYQIRGMGNRLRHEYRAIDHDIVWETITGPDLRELKAALEKY